VHHVLLEKLIVVNGVIKEMILIVPDLNVIINKVQRFLKTRWFQPNLVLCHRRVDTLLDLVFIAQPFTLIILVLSTSGEETINSKVAFEKMAHGHDVSIKSFHADNGRFAEAGFREDCDKCNRSISFCAVGAHHQNGIAEAGIKRFTLSARTSLLHAKRLCPEAITTMLWPFALQYSVEIYNTFHLDSNGNTPLMKFSGVNELRRIENFHPFGCPSLCAGMCSSNFEQRNTEVGP